MKRLFTLCLMAVTMYSFVGCGKEDDGGNVSDNGGDNGGGSSIEAPAKKVKKITVESTNGNIVTEAYYTWTGDMLTSISFKDDYFNGMDFSYNNGKLSQMVWHGDIDESYTYTWNGNKIVTETIHGGDQDGLVSNYEYTGDKVTKITQMGYDAYNITWTGDNVESVTLFGELLNGPITYDDKHNPLNVQCGQSYLIVSSYSALYSLLYPSWSKNNVIDNPSFYSEEKGSDGLIEYTYDSDGFPTMVTCGGEMEIILRYEY